MSARKTPPKRPSPKKAPRKPLHVSKHGGDWLTIKDLADLFRNEKAIVDRIITTLNGGYLFMTNPLMLLKDIGVNLSPAARAALLKREPRLSDHSPTAYRALKTSTDQQTVTFKLRGLFEREHS